MISVAVVHPASAISDRVAITPLGPRRSHSMNHATTWAIAVAATSQTSTGTWASSSSHFGPTT